VRGTWGDETVEGRAQQQQKKALTVRVAGRSFTIKDERNREAVFQAEGTAGVLDLPHPEKATRSYKPRTGPKKKRTVTRAKSGP
jgi:hypothetical protein